MRQPVAALLLAIAVGRGMAFAAPLQDSSFQSISNYYARIVARLSPKHVPFEMSYLEKLSPQMVTTKPQLSRMTDIVAVDAPLHLIVDQHSAAILQLWNHRLAKFVATNDVQEFPALSIPEAIRRAVFYLGEVGVGSPSNCALKTVSFGGDYPSLWAVAWAPVAGRFAYDEFVRCYIQGVSVVFHEEYGFCGYSCDLSFPRPTSTTVKVAKEEAIIRASKAAPLVMKTPFYRQCRASGFKVTGVKNAELKIAAPNWLLDPERAIWIRERPPDETRVCWIVRFETVDTVDRGAMKLMAVDILIYIDAATGEVVGANFT